MCESRNALLLSVVRMASWKVDQYKGGIRSKVEHVELTDILSTLYANYDMTVSIRCHGSSIYEGV